MLNEIGMWAAWSEWVDCWWRRQLGVDEDTLGRRLLEYLHLAKKTSLEELVFSRIELSQGGESESDREFICQVNDNSAIIICYNNYAMANCQWRHMHIKAGRP